MAILTVNTAVDRIADDGRLSLREAASQADTTPGFDTIRFAHALEGQTLVLAAGELVLSSDVRIDGDADNAGVEVALSGGNASRVLRITGFNTDAFLRDLTITGGNTSGDREGGGGIRAEDADLRLDEVTVTGNSTSGNNASGGGIYSDGRLILSHSTIADNVTQGLESYGGGIYGGFIALADSSISGNRTGGDDSRGGGLFSREDVSLTDSAVADNRTSGYRADGGGISAFHLSATRSIIIGNSTNGPHGDGGGITGGTMSLYRVTIADNHGTEEGGGVLSYGGRFSLSNSTVVGNQGGTGALRCFGTAEIFNSTITGNTSGLSGRSEMVLGNTIIAGNGIADVYGTVSASNGHNVFGSDVTGAVVGDKQGVAPRILFAAVDPETGGGQINAAGIVPLRNSGANPALGGGDPLATLIYDQVGASRPLPAGSLPDIGAAERHQLVSTSPTSGNDVLTGTAAGDIISAGSGADVVLGLAGKDILRGEGGSDVLDGGPGNDLLDGGEGINLARFGGTTAVTVDLVAGKATRGAETDNLSSIRGAIGSDAADTFRGDSDQNWFHGGLGRDVFTGGAGRDVYDFDRVQDSLPGASTRDVITDFSPRSDRIDLTGIDADTTQAGNQAFEFIAPGQLSGAGELTFATSGTDTIASASVDADAAPELEIRLSGVQLFGSYMFYL